MNPSDRVPPPPRKPSPRAHRLIFRYQGSQRVMFILGAIFSPVGLLVFLGFMVPAVYGFTAWRNPLQVSATPLNVEEEENNSSIIYYISYEYALNGERFTGGSVASFEEAERARQKLPIAVEVQASAPSNARLSGKSDWWVFLIFALLFGAPFVVAGLVLLFLSIRENRREILAYTRGAPIMARITDASDDRSTKENGKHPFVVSWEFSVQGKTYQGKLSSMDRQELEPLLSSYELVALYLPEDPSINTVYIE